MFELILMAVLCVVMGKIADLSDRRPVIWVLVTIGACALSLLIPLPFLRVLIAAVAVFVAMMIVKK